MTWIPIVGKGFLPINFREYVSTVELTWKPSMIVVHNTQAPTFAQWHDTPGEERMKNLESYYRDELKWHAGPHLFVADDLIWAFTPLSNPGVHSPSWNAISWGVEVVGDYDWEVLTPIIWANLNLVISVLCEKAGISPGDIKLHHEDPLTTHKFCPGKNLDKVTLVNNLYHILGAQNA